MHTNTNREYIRIYSKQPIIWASEGEKNMDNPKYFVCCIHRTSQVTLHNFYTAYIYFEK
jgi:hypothetical protein